MAKVHETEHAHVNIIDEKILKRLKVIEGQVGGIIKMAQTGRSCEEVTTQISSIVSSLKSVSRVILDNHIKHCVVEGIKNQQEEETLTALSNMIDQIYKMK